MGGFGGERGNPPYGGFPHRDKFRFFRIEAEEVRSTGGAEVMNPRRLRSNVRTDSERSEIV